MVLTSNAGHDGMEMATKTNKVTLLVILVAVG